MFECLLLYHLIKLIALILDNFKTAQKRLKKAEETSNVDSESDSDSYVRRKRSKPNTPRKRSRPGSYHYAELSECFDGKL